MVFCGLTVVFRPTKTTVKPQKNTVKPLKKPMPQKTHGQTIFKPWSNHKIPRSNHKKHGQTTKNTGQTTKNTVNPQRRSATTVTCGFSSFDAPNSVTHSLTHIITPRDLLLLLSSCARGAGTHGDVLNVHTEAISMDTRGGEGGSPSVLLTKICPRRVITIQKSQSRLCKNQKKNKKQWKNQKKDENEKKTK